MTHPWRRLPVRVRLVAGFAAAMLVLLVAAGVFVYWRVEYALDRELDVELGQETAVVASLVGETGTVTSTERADATGTAWQVLARDGTVLDSGGPAPARVLVPVTDLARVGASPVVVEVGSMLPTSDRPYRVRLTSLPGGSGRVLLVGVDRRHRDEALRELLLQLTLAGLGALTIASLVGERLAWAALHPVERYRSRAAQIAAGASDVRLEVPAGRDDEVTRLGDTLNAMLDAQQDALAHERRFVDDASHELRTPLTLLTSRIQLARRRTRSIAEHEQVLAELEVDVDRLNALAEQLLELSTRPQGSSDVADVLADTLARHRQAGLVLEGLASGLPKGLPRVAVPPIALDRVVTNLVTNAFAHGRPPVHLVVEERAGQVVLTVSDAGPGMTPDLLAGATERFARAPEARSRPGAGLGLSLVEQVVVSDGGELRLCSGGHHTSHGPDSGLPCRHTDAMTVTVVLPPATAEHPI